MVTLSEAQEAALLRRAQHLGQTPDDCLNELLYGPLPPRRWTPQEDAMILDPRNKPQTLAHRFNRSAHSISVRRTRLREQVSRPALSPTPQPPSAAPAPPPAPAPPVQHEPPAIHLRTEPCPYCLPAKPDPTCRICLGSGSIDTMPES
jgi:hypothetical protein